MSAEQKVAVIAGASRGSGGRSRPGIGIRALRVRSIEGAAAPMIPGRAGHHHAPDPVPVKGTFVEAVLKIVDTSNGERMRLTAARLTDNADVSVVIRRPDGEEKLPLLPQDGQQGVLMSTDAPAEPHEFDARLRFEPMACGDRAAITNNAAFKMR